MSTIVKYKGSTIATLTSETKSLTTSGTWLEDDIELTDHSVGNIYQDENGYLIIDDGGDTAQRFTMEEIAQDRSFASGDVVYNGTKVYPYAFANCSLTSFIGANVQVFNTASDNTGCYVFSNCTNLISVSLPSLTNTGSGGYQFYNCTKLTDVYMPLCTTGQHMFQGCTSLVNIVFAQDKPTAATMNSYGFYNCTKLQRADLGNVTKINGNEFAGCTVLNTLILRRTDAITELSNINNFTNSPFASGKAGGTLYVPSSLISTYEAATNWSTILGYTNNSIQAIEGSIYETKYADGTTISS